MKKDVFHSNRIESTLAIVARIELLQVIYFLTFGGYEPGW